MNITGDLIIHKKGMVLLSYGSDKSDLMEDIAKRYQAKIVREITPYHAVETYLEQLI
jgi:hypothetical protein